MLQPKYRAEYYVVDDITGEMYAHTTEGLVAIKEQAYLDRAIALEATAAEFPEVSSTSASPPGISKLSTDQSRKEETPDHSEKKEETQKKRQELTSKDALNQAVPAGSPVNSNYLQEKKEALLLHIRAMQEYLAMRSQHKKLEGEMMIYEIPGKEPGVTTDQEIARERFYAEGACRRALDKEMPFFQKYLETSPMSPEVDTLSLSSLDSYEAEEEWNKTKYRKLLFKYDHGERQYAVLCRDLDVLREPECATELNKELALSREELEQRQKKGAQLKEIAKAQVNFIRQRQNIVQEAVRIEQQKHQQEREEWYRSKETELAERTHNWTGVARKEIGKIREAYEQEKKELQALRVRQEQLHKEELDQKLARETDLLQQLEQQQIHQEAILTQQKEDRNKDYQEWQEDRLAWEENQGLKDQMVKDLREALKKEQETSAKE